MSAVEVDGDSGMVLRKVYFFRAGAGHADKNARLAGDALIELARWLESGVAFDLSFSREDEAAHAAEDESR